jgi:uncharacterized protein (TIGR02001 family)
VLGRQFTWLAAILLCLISPSVGIAAQLEVSAAVDSDYQAQGLSLSDGEPAVSVSLAADGPRGVYAGVTAIADATRHAGVQPLGFVAYAGFARRFDQGGDAWDVGIIHTDAVLHLSRRYELSYTQIYAGLSKGSVSVHLFYAPTYLYENVGAAYLDLSGAFHPAARWRLFGHVGALALIGAEAPADGSRIDIRVGVAREFGTSEVRLMWTASSRAVVYPTGDRAPGQALVLGATHAF